MFLEGGVAITASDGRCGNATEGAGAFSDICPFRYGALIFDGGKIVAAIEGSSSDDGYATSKLKSG